ncbi:hypothetical protein FI667_g9404, partial [Globisporangium splendens]
MDPTNIQAWKYRLRVFAAMELWVEAQELLASNQVGKERKKVESLYRGHSFVRKFRQVKSDSAALQDLLLNAPMSDLTHAFSVSLGENNFLTVLDTLVHIRRTGGIASIDKATRILHLLLGTARFRFFSRDGAKRSSGESLGV